MDILWASIWVTVACEAAAIAIIWRKFKVMTLEESAISSINFIKQIVQDTKTSINEILAYENSFANKIGALIAAVQNGGEIPQTVTDALNELVDTSKSLSSARSLLDEVPSQLDSVIDGLTPKANG